MGKIEENGNLRRNDKYEYNPFYAPTDMSGWLCYCFLYQNLSKIKLKLKKNECIEPLKVLFP